MFVEEASIVDPAPTILYLLGLPIPDDMDGQVLAQALEPDLLARRSIQREHRDASDEQDVGGYLDEAEEEQIREALRGFGYIE